MQTLDGTILEALVNVREHARAITVTVELHEVEDDRLIRMVDDGVGYDPADVEGHACRHGLVLVQERIMLTGGWCRIESSPGPAPLSSSGTTRRVVHGAGCIVIGRVEDGQSPG